MKKDIEWLKEKVDDLQIYSNPDVPKDRNDLYTQYVEGVNDAVRQVKVLVGELDEPEPKNISLQDVTQRLWELPSNNRKDWLEQLNVEFQEGYIVPLGLKTTDGEEQYLTFNDSYFACRRNRDLQQMFGTLEEIPEFYRDLAERVL